MPNLSADSDAPNTSTYERPHYGFRFFAGGSGYSFTRVSVTCAIGKSMHPSHLSRVEQSKGVDGMFDGIHQLHRSFAQFFDKVIFLADTYSMFPSTYQ